MILLILKRKEVKNMKINNEKLEVAMANAMMNYKQLAEATGMTQESFVRIKKGKQNPRPASVGRIAQALKVKVEDLVD